MTAHRRLRHHGAAPLPKIATCLCGKVYSPTKNDARINRLAYANAAGALNPVRYYQCDHGGWHWTSHTTRTTEERSQ